MRPSLFNRPLAIKSTEYVNLSGIKGKGSRQGFVVKGQAARGLFVLVLVLFFVLLQGPYTAGAAVGLLLLLFIFILRSRLASRFSLRLEVLAAFTTTIPFSLGLASSNSGVSRGIRRKEEGRKRKKSKQ